ncbi:DEKNAAC105265 [Brettanomyces naardenensis]|uniref:DEKNAAC105265 n=1 Tax=Brettanomyces naardenensis TaxID=13370 RepID=A0A448YT02_BRENA|nr:DEKNAAC105265 [Brettanomyces naardenensis]
MSSQEPSQIDTKDDQKPVPQPVQSAFGPSKFAAPAQPSAEPQDEDPEGQRLAEMKQQMAQMQQEAAKLRRMQAEFSTGDSVESSTASADSRGSTETTGDGAVAATSSSGDPTVHLDIEQRKEIDNRSVFVSNVDFAATPEELQKHFSQCGTISRVTILTNKFTGNPKGYAYVEFSSPESVQVALQLNDSLFKGRMLKVTEKRTNLPGFSRGRGRGRARGRGFRGGFRGRARGRGAFKPY